MASSELQQDCDTELRLGRPASPPPPPCAREEKAPATPPCGGLTATELQATAILRMARRAAAAEEGRAGPSGDGADARLSTRRSLERFLQRRQQEAGRWAGAATSPSSASCLTDGSI